MREEPSNGEILEKLKGLHALSEEKLNGINTRLDTLNSQTEKNTDWRLLHKGAYKIVGILGVVATAAWGMATDVIKTIFHST